MCGSSTDISPDANNGKVADDNEGLEETTDSGSDCDCGESWGCGGSDCGCGGGGGG